MIVENRFIDKPLHGTARVSDDDIIIGYRSILTKKDKIRTIRKEIKDVYKSCGISEQAFSQRIKRLRDSGFID